MSTTGTYVWNPTLTEIYEDCFERVGIDPADIGARHIVSARRSMKYVMNELTVKKINQWKVESYLHTTAVGETTFTLPAGVIEITTATVMRGGVETPMNLIDRSDYHALHDKTLVGLPNRYYIEKKRDLIECVYWNAGENATDVISLNCVYQLEDVGDNAQNTLDLPVYFQSAFAYGLSAKLAEKFAPARMKDYEAKYGFWMKEASNANRKRADVTFTTPSVTSIGLGNG